MGVSQHREHVTYAALRELNTSSYAYTVFGRTNLTSQTNWAITVPKFSVGDFDHCSTDG